MVMSKQMETLMSSKRQDWATPNEVFNPINEIFEFNLDVCATEENAKVQAFIDPEMDAFSVPWLTPDGDKETVAWMNPPYGKPESACVRPHDKCKKKKCIERGYHQDKYVPGVGDWLKRAYEQSIEEI